VRKEVIEGTVRTYLMATRPSGVPEYMENHCVYDVEDDANMMLTADMLTLFEGKTVRVTIEEIANPDDRPED